MQAFKCLVNRGLHRRVRIAALGALVAALVPAGALGATAEIVDVDGRSILLYSAGTGEANRVFVFGDRDSDSVAIIDSGASITPGRGCTLTLDPHTVGCADPAGATLGGLSISLGNLADGYASPFPFITLPAVVDGGTGNDLLFGGAGPDTLLGGGGKDFLDGGGESDTLEGGNGADVLFDQLGQNVLRGGGGPDLLLLPSASDVQPDCGDGDDRLIVVSFVSSVSCEETLFFFDAGGPAF